MPKQHQFDVLIICSGTAGLIITVESALSRKESRGIHFNQDHPKQLDKAHNSVIIKS